MTKKFNPKNSVCVITGASSGIGKALGLELLARGATRIINIDPASVDYECDHYPVDVGHHNELIAVIDEVKSKYNSIDLYCMNAGACHLDNHEDDMDHWNKVMNINFWPSVIAMQRYLPDMLKAGRGHFLLTSSAAGMLALPGGVTYTVSKHALRSLAEWMAGAYTTLGIGVHVLCPQGVITDMTEKEHPFNTQLKKGGLFGEMLTPQQVATITLDQMAQGTFMILTHDGLKQRAIGKAENIEWFIEKSIETHDTYIQELFTKKSTK